MNTIQEIRRINEAELAAGTKGSWHDQYKDSAYIHVGGLPFNLTEGDVITIFSQYGEIVDVSMPRDPNTQKPRGFAFLMYADQRSTVLAVDNLNGAKVLQRTLKVDHVLNYKQLERDQETGKMKEREAPSMAAHPERFLKDRHGGDEDEGSDSDSSHPSIDPDDPMRDYLIEQKRTARKNGSSRKHKQVEGGETKEQKRARKEERRRIREERARRKAIKAGPSHDDHDRRKEEASRSRTRNDHDDVERDSRRRDDGSSQRDRSPARDRDRHLNKDRHERADRYRGEVRDRRDHGQERDRDGTTDRRGGVGGRGISAFADLEAWAAGK
ncbi:RNA-binding protein Cwf29 [Microbotryomycetes sp. JL201]|nr:RNA-binding protein Cwf29 [Microbotryomycetes sp. JL201]